MKTKFNNFNSWRAVLSLIFATGLTGAMLYAGEPATPPVPVDPHAGHQVASDATKGDAALAQQLSQLQAKMVLLEATLAKNAPAAAPVAAMPGMSPPAVPAGPMAGMSPPMDMMGMMSKMMGKMDKMMSMSGTSATGAPMANGASGGMSGGGMGMGTDKMGMMGMMNKMMGMMDKMMPMSGGATSAAGAPMAGGMGGGGMGMMKSEMGGMGMDKMGMMGMGNMASMAGGMPQDALPGFPGASHLYHLGATGFFLDHSTHIALTTEQTASLNLAKEKAALAKSTADRAIEQAEQELWTLTAADQPDIAAIEAKTAEIGKLSGTARVAFIRAVGEASKILTEAQRKSLTGFAPPSPAAAPMAGGMSGM